MFVRLVGKAPPELGYPNLAQTVFFGDKLPQTHYLVIDNESAWLHFTSILSCYNQHGHGRQIITFLFAGLHSEPETV